MSTWMPWSRRISLNKCESESVGVVHTQLVLCGQLLTSEAPVGPFCLLHQRQEIQKTDLQSAENELPWKKDEYGVSAAADDTHAVNQPLRTGRALRNRKWRCMGGVMNEWAETQTDACIMRLKLKCMKWKTHIQKTALVVSITLALTEGLTLLPASPGHRTLPPAVWSGCPRSASSAACKNTRMLVKTRAGVQQRSRRATAAEEGSHFLKSSRLLLKLCFNNRKSVTKTFRQKLRTNLLKRRLLVKKWVTFKTLKLIVIFK